MQACALMAVIALLPPPQLIRSGSGRTSIRVPISDAISISILEADAEQQGVLVDAALESTAPVGGKDDDPYGVVLWPAAQVVANAIAGIEGVRGAALLELGAGTGLCSLAALRCGAARVLATDYREEPLELLRESARANGLGAEGRGAHGTLSTALFDICGADALPTDAEYVVAADVLYLRSTSIALARRCVEALRSPMCREVLVGDLGRPGRQPFLAELVAQGVREDAAAFTAVKGWLPGGPRHELVSTAHEEGSGPQQASVGLLRLVPEDLLPCDVE
jgi:predicted nicotinamide N-methyase